MPFHILHGDITTLQVDAIVNAANETLLGGGGVDGAIHRAAGPRLLEECRTLGGCRTGEAKITKGYDLPARYVIHTVGPIWSGGTFGEAKLLESAYRNSLAIAAAYGCGSVAFPLISSGVYGYPKAEALRIATETIRTFLEDHEMDVILVIFDKYALQLLDDPRFAGLQEYLHFNYQPPEEERMNAALDEESVRKQALRHKPISFRGALVSMDGNGLTDNAVPGAESASASLPDLLENLDESFSQMLLRKIDERGMKDSECYKRANIDRKLFSKIRSNPDYRPSKATALAFAVALELSLKETNDLLRKAGYALSRSNKFDVIVEYFIRSRNYNIYDINEALFAYDQVLLGG